MDPSRMPAAFALWLLVACAEPAPRDPPAAPLVPIGEVLAAPAPPPPAAPPPIEVEAAAAAPTAPQELYASCRERVELPEQAGECSSNADCVAGGCSKEICTTRAAMSGLMSTCEILPCFQVLDDCGCHEGLCTWTLKEGAPSPGLPVPGGATTAPAG